MINLSNDYPAFWKIVEILHLTNELWLGINNPIVSFVSRKWITDPQAGSSRLRITSRILLRILLDIAFFLLYCFFRNQKEYTILNIENKQICLFVGSISEYQAIGEAHRRYTRRINFREGWRGHLWQGRFSSFIMDEMYLLACTRYVELNPARAAFRNWFFYWNNGTTFGPKAQTSKTWA